MKKTVKSFLLLMTAAAVMTAMTACSAPKEEGGNAPQLISGGTAATTVAKENNGSAPASQANTGTYGLTFKGVLLTPGMETEKAIKALGEGYVLNSVDSCAFNGKESTYDYKEIVIYTDDHDGTDKINTIDVRDPSVDCGGVKIGSTLDDVKKVYGEPTSEESYGLSYVKDHTQIQFIFADGDKLTSIMYKSI